MVRLFRPDGTIEKRPGNAIAQDGPFFRIYDRPGGRELEIVERQHYTVADTDDGRYVLVGFAKSAS